jgi:hypothetical protein
MANFFIDSRRLLEALRRNLPLAALPRKASAQTSLQRAAPTALSHRSCLVTDVFDAGDGLGLMCQLQIREGGRSSFLVTPITELAFDRSHPISRDVAKYRRMRAKRRA